MSTEIWARLAMIAVAVGLAGLGRATQPETATDQKEVAPATPTIPETPVGADFAAVLEAIGTPGAKLDAGRFSESFLRQVPEAQLNAVLAQLRAQVKALKLVSFEGETSGSRLVAVCRAERGGEHWRVFIEHDEAGKIAGLLLRPAPELSIEPLKGWTDLDARLAKFGGVVSFGAYELAGTVEAPELRAVHTLNAEARLAIGSTFKLWVLGALAEMVAEGEADWNQPLAVKDELKSLPGGQMQNDAAGTEHPLSHFAREMIRISDNTATDHLLAFVGREAAEAYMARFSAEPDRNRPFLSTREMFVLKVGGDVDLAKQFAAADEQEQKAMVASGGPLSSGAPNIVLASMWRMPIMIEQIEWFASAEECCRTLADLRRLAAEPGQEPVRVALSANPGLPLDDKVWSGFFYKGGSEPGVFNLSWLLERQDGRTFVVSIGFNNTEAAIDESAALAVTGAMLMLLAEAP